MLEEIRDSTRPQSAVGMKAQSLGNYPLIQASHAYCGSEHFAWKCEIRHEHGSSSVGGIDQEVA